MARWIMKQEDCAKLPHRCLRNAAHSRGFPSFPDSSPSRQANSRPARARRIAWIPARGHKALSHRSHDTKRQRGSTCEKRKTTEPRVLRDDARKHRVHRRRGARGGARESGSSGARRRGRLRRRVLRVSFREIAAKSKTHLHDIASSDARRTQGFPRVAREEVGELALLLLLSTRGFVALARLEVRARAPVSYTHLTLPTILLV